MTGQGGSAGATGAGVRRWADEHQYDAEPHSGATADNGVLPSVTLLHMNADPLGQMAAFNGIYSGKVVRSLADVTDEMRSKALDDVQKTHLKAPLETLRMHFLIEGVDRAFTHQHVRQRTGNFGQESMRFAVLGDLEDAATLPPSLAGTRRSDKAGELMPTGRDEENRAAWDDTLRQIDKAYHFLVSNGVPSEEARGLLPHATATRLHYQTDMRNLSDHAGNRLCTQAQFHWRIVFAQIVDAIRNYTPDFSWVQDGDNRFVAQAINQWERKYRWQFEAIADSGLFRPACYQLNYCPFGAEFDRSCTIRQRVEVRSNHGNKSEHWGEDFEYLEAERQYGVSGLVVAKRVQVAPIRNEEWLADPAAARKVS